MTETTNNLPAASNDLPDYLKAMAGTAPAQNTAVDAMASAAMSIPRVSMRGKKFRFIEGGEEIFACNDKVNIVIVGVEPDSQRFVKTYYEKGYTGANDTNPPTCASDDGVAPSGWVATPQARSCAECPKNRFGSATSRTGKPSKACRDSKRLWVIRHEDLVKKVEKPTLYAMGVTVMSLKSLSEFGKEMKAMNVPISAAMVEVIMDDDSEFPMISFKRVGWLDETTGKAIIDRSEKAEWKLNQIQRPALAAPAANAAGGAVQPLNVALPGQPVAQPAAQPAAQAAPAAEAVKAPEPPKNMNDVVSNW